MDVSLSIWPDKTPIVGDEVVDMGIHYRGLDNLCQALAPLMPNLKELQQKAARQSAALARASLATGMCFSLPELEWIPIEADVCITWPGQELVAAAVAVEVWPSDLIIQIDIGEDWCPVFEVRGKHEAG